MNLISIPLIHYVETGHTWAASFANSAFSGDVQV